MTKQIKEAKKLAADYFYRNRKLTEKERFIVESSPFGNVLKPAETATKFNKILEQYGMDNGVVDLMDVPEGLPKRKSNYTPWIKKHYVRELLDQIEEKFNVGMYNVGVGKYKNIDCDILKQFVQNFVSRNRIQSGSNETAEELLDIANNCGDVYKVMYKLYFLAK
jgi:hypothetical protein